MKNGQLKPGYNLQLSTQNQFILNYTLHQSPTDTATLPAHLDNYKELINQMPEVLTADAGYGSEENYHYLEQNCRGCPKWGSCHKQKGNRIIEVNYRLRKHKAMAREKLLSELGTIYRKKRPAEVEAQLRSSYAAIRPWRKKKSDSFETPSSGSVAVRFRQSSKNGNSVETTFRREANQSSAPVGLW